MKHFHKTLLRVFLSVGFLNVMACQQAPDSSGGSGPIKFLPFSIPTLSTEYYGTLAIHGGKGHVSWNELSDPTEAAVTQTLSFKTSAANYFGTGDAVSSPAVNSTALAASGTGQGLHYFVAAPTLYTDGTANTFTWTAGGVNYSSSVSGNIGQVTIATPVFNSVHSKSSDLGVTWTSCTDPGAYCLIELVGKANQGSTSTTTSYFKTYTEDNGSYTIPAATLSGFSESHATLLLHRGKFVESTIGGHSFITVMYTTDQTDIDLS